MRLIRWACVGLVALAFSGNVRAQGSPQTALTGVSPSKMVFKKVDTGEVLRSPNGAMSSGASGFTLTNFFRRLTGPGPQTFRGRSDVPAPRFANPITPALPINSIVPKR